VVDETMQFPGINGASNGLFSFQCRAGPRIASGHHGELGQAAASPVALVQGPSVEPEPSRFTLHPVASSAPTPTASRRSCAALTRPVLNQSLDRRL